MESSSVENTMNKDEINEQSQKNRRWVKNFLDSLKNVKRKNSALGTSAELSSLIFFVQCLRQNKGNRDSNHIQISHKLT